MQCKINSLPRKAIEPRGHTFAQIAVSNDHLASGRERPRTPRWKYTRSPRKRKVLVRVLQLGESNNSRGGARSLARSRTTEFRPIRGDSDAPATAFVSVRDDYPVVQFMPANDCNLRSIRLVKHFPSPFTSPRPRLSTLLVLRCFSPPPFRLAGSTSGPVHSHAEKCKTPRGNERFVIGRR